MAGHNLFMNWTGVTFTPLSGTAVTIDKVTSVKPDLSSDVERFKGDLARFNQAVAAPNNNRTVAVDSGNITALMSLPLNTPGTLVAILADYLNGTGTGSGAIQVTLTPCLCTGKPFSGDHAKFAG